jgi:hypothetical protein
MEKFLRVYQMIIYIKRRNAFFPAVLMFGQVKIHTLLTD